METAELRKRIRAANEEMKTAGPLHARDLERHIKRLRRIMRKNAREQARTDG